MCLASPGPRLVRVLEEVTAAGRERPSPGFQGPPQSEKATALVLIDYFIYCLIPTCEFKVTPDELSLQGCLR